MDSSSTKHSFSSMNGLNSQGCGLYREFSVVCTLLNNLHWQILELPKWCECMQITSWWPLILAQQWSSASFSQVTVFIISIMKILRIISSALFATILFKKYNNWWHRVACILFYPLSGSLVHNIAISVHD